jgi:hypothetical protein
MVCRSACVLLVEFRSKYDHASEEETAAVLYQSWSFQYNLEDLSKQVHWMVNAGGRYINIEKSLGTGSFLVLGKDISETTYITFILIDSRWLTYLGGPNCC